MPGSQFLEDMEPTTYLWLFYAWVEEQQRQEELIKNYSVLIGSFTDPERASKMLGLGNVIEVSEEDFEKTMEMIDQLPDINTPKKKHRRKIRK